MDFTENNLDIWQSIEPNSRSQNNPERLLQE